MWLAGCGRGGGPVSIPATGVVELPAGTLPLSAPLEVPAGAHDLTIRGAKEGSTLTAAAGFNGAALLVVRKAARVRIENVHFDGKRHVLAADVGLPPSEVPFSRFSQVNGILAEDVDALTVTGGRFVEIVSFAVLAARSRNVTLRGLVITDSGWQNAKGRNNTTGGILLEEGCQQFEVAECRLENVRGNGIWTHSVYGSARNAGGRIAGNAFRRIGRDAIQVGHATGVIVENNLGSEIGYPEEDVDIETGAVPVGVDTAGNVESCHYRNNRFTEVNGKCVDLDGFHHGTVTGNVCINTGPVEKYPHGHYGIVFNNSNPDMRSEAVEVSGNHIEGFRFGGLFVIGRDHVVRGNRFLKVNLARCNENPKISCVYKGDEPDLLQSGIYFGQEAHRPDPATRVRVENNEVTGHRMRDRCFGYAPRVKREEIVLAGNRCGEGK